MLQSHRYRVPLQHQLLGSPHLLLLHLPADRLFGLVGQLTARRQARISDYLFNPSEKDQRPKNQLQKNGRLNPLSWSPAENTEVEGETQKKWKCPVHFFWLRRSCFVTQNPEFVFPVKL